LIVNDVFANDVVAKAKTIVNNNNNNKIVLMNSLASNNAVVDHGGVVGKSYIGGIGEQKRDIVKIVSDDLNSKIMAAIAGGGIARWNIIIDPGLGFGKSVDENYKLVQSLSTISARCNNQDILIGPSRKSFLSQQKLPPQNIVEGTIGVCLNGQGPRCRSGQECASGIYQISSLFQ
jgi:dihydropteroate synthase